MGSKLWRVLQCHRHYRVCETCVVRALKKHCLTLSIDLCRVPPRFFLLYPRALVFTLSGLLVLFAALVSGTPWGRGVTMMGIGRQSLPSLWRWIGIGSRGSRLHLGGRVLENQQQ